MKAAAKAISMVLESGKVNYYTLLEDETLSAKRLKLNEMYQQNMVWIANNLPGNVSGCWGCNKNTPRVQPILV
jgi:hypothetical protein